jgi:PAS domain S-box-containing protein
MAESLRILILEDNPTDTELIQFELQEAGFIFTSKMVMAEKDFVRELQEFSPDLILSSYDLPKYNGALALAETISRRPDTPFILVTGAIGEDRAIELLAQGAKDYVLKTRLQQRLAPAVRRALAEAEEQKARKKMDETLREQLHFMRQLLDAIPIPIFYKDRQGMFRGCNMAYEKFVGMSKEQVVGKTVFGVFPQDLADIYHQADEALYTQPGAQVYETSFLHADGNRHDIIFNKATYVGMDGYVAGLVGVILDITDRKRAEEEKRRNQETTERLAEEMAIIAEIGRVVGSTLDINQVFERVATEVHKLIPYDGFRVNLKKADDNTFVVVYIYGFDNTRWKLGDSYPSKGTVTDVVMTTRKGILIQPADAEEIKDLYPTFYATFKMGLRSAMNVPLISLDKVIGSLTFRSKKLKAYTEQDIRLAEKIGMQIAGAIANAQLFNDLNKTEKSLRESEERLHRAEKMEALGQLAGGVAHDLNNVLGVSTIYSELLQEKIPEESPLRKYVDNILSSTQKGAAIIQDLLTLARRSVTVSDVMNLNDIVSNFLKTPVFDEIRAYHPNVTFRTECQEDLLNIKGSPLHLEKTLINLVSNAAEAISGKGEVSIRVENRYLDKPIRGYDEVKEGDYAVLTVSDTGMGIPAENIGKIFEPFYTKKNMGRSGTGLGLAIVWGTVKDHQGYIDLHTEVGEGTTFTLYFPVTREDRGNRSWWSTTWPNNGTSPPDCLPGSVIGFMPLPAEKRRWNISQAIGRTFWSWI